MTPQRHYSAGIIVFGAKGMLGQELMSSLAPAAPDALRGYDLPAVDICDGDAVRDLLLRFRPSVVINAAAYTDVDGCEANRDQAMSVNCDGAGIIGRACAEIDATMVHFGTDFIFDGRSTRPYEPDHPANPLSVYGRSKWMGEEAVRKAGCPHLLVRTSWLFGPAGRNFVEAILTQAEAGKKLRVVADQVGSPTLAAHLAEAVVNLLDAGAAGAVHFANAGSCSWFEFAEEIVKQAGLEQPIERISSDELARPAKRPAYSVLDTSRYAALTGRQPRPWNAALAEYLEVRRGPQSSRSDGWGAR